MVVIIYYMNWLDLAQSTADQTLIEGILEMILINASLSGYMSLFNPSSRHM
jgi:hypothetical protein